MSIHTLDWQEIPPASSQGGAVTVGNFDGVHLGHVALLSLARQAARESVGPAVALTFDPHPLQILRPERFLPVLSTLADRTRLLLENGADEVIVVAATPALLQLSAEDFFQEVLCKRLSARALVEGPTFGFGRGRGGDIETLAQLCRGAGIPLSICPRVEIDGQPVASSRVRAAIVSGAVADATRLLGRPYRLHGRVATGQRRGRTLGFPTANLDPLYTLAPGDGVYAARVHRGGTTWPAAANIGPNPTFGEHARKVEVHIIGFDGDLYGQDLGVDFIERLRDTRPFASVEDLVQQLRHDVDAARRLAGREAASGLGDA